MDAINDIIDLESDYFKILKSKKLYEEARYNLYDDIVEALSKIASKDAKLVFNKWLPLGISKLEHYQTFFEVFEEAVAEAKKNSGQNPDYMICSFDCIPILNFVKWFVPNSITENSFKVGKLGSITVYASARLTNKFIVGVGTGGLNPSWLLDEKHCVIGDIIYKEENADED